MTIHEMAVQAQALQQALQTGEISPDEYKELVNNIGLVQAIEDQTSQLEENIMYRDIIIGAINVAKALA
jgi:polyhydroxyalkanoate synthesis regulator phasin